MEKQERQLEALQCQVDEIDTGRFSKAKVCGIFYGLQSKFHKNGKFDLMVACHKIKVDEL